MNEIPARVRAGIFYQIFVRFLLDKNICSSYSFYRTKVRNRRFSIMTGWTLFFTVLGVVFLTTQVFRILEAIERPTRRSRRRAYAR